jgi:hypothetical protein
MSQHYVVEMRVIRVDFEDKPAAPRDGRLTSKTDHSTRTVTEIAKHTVKGDMFEKTIEKAQAYLALAEDFDAIDPIPKGNTR